MRWFEKLANFLESKGRSRIIMDREVDDVYLVRYYVMFKERPWWFPFNIVLHKVLRSDPDGLHNHPWMFWGSYIINGGYWERTFSGRKWIKPGSFRMRMGVTLKELFNTLTFRSKRKDTFDLSEDLASSTSLEISPPGDFHRLELDKEMAGGEETWTLFIMGPKFKEWGFIRDLNQDETYKSTYPNWRWRNWQDYLKK